MEKKTSQMTEKAAGSNSPYTYDKLAGGAKHVDVTLMVRLGHTFRCTPSDGSDREHVLGLLGLVLNSGRLRELASFIAL
jgi:hypothetical protein